MDAGLGIAFGGFFISIAAVLIASITGRKNNQTADWSQLERRIVLCEDDRKQLHAELNSVREHNFWLTQKLIEAGHTVPPAP